MYSSFQNLPKSSLKPFSMGDVLIGLELNSNDNSLLEYFEYLTRFMAWDTLTLLHVVPQKTISVPDREIYPANKMVVSDEQRFDIAQQLNEIVVKSLNLPDQEKIDYYIRAGMPLFELAELASEKSISTVLIGKKADTRQHAILAKNIHRFSRANLWMVPQKSLPLIRDILVPIDFSENSLRALKVALSIKEQVATPITVKAINIYQKPELVAYKLTRSPDDLQKKIAINHKEGFHKYIMEHLPSYRDEIVPVLIESVNPDITAELLRVADSLDSDLIVIGAKGYSRLERMLLGSTTERLLNKDDKVPVLVVK